MDLKEKQLLLADLCARLPYGVKVWYKYETWNCKMFATSIRLVYEKIALSSKFNREGDWYPIEEAGEILIKPYLRPMSSMTEEEVDGFFAAGNKDMDILENALSHEPIITFGSKIHHGGITYNEIDYLLAHHFDFRGLIPLGLALEAPEGMYN